MIRTCFEYVIVNEINSFILQFKLNVLFSDKIYWNDIFDVLLYVFLFIFFVIIDNKIWMFKELEQIMIQKNIF